MKRFCFILLGLLCIPIGSVAQITWNTDMTVAKGVSLSEGKLILVDFWATWCGPCKKMDKELWNLPEIKTLSEKVILLKVDIDRHRDIALKYNVKSIPKVIVISAAEDIILEEIGYRGVHPYLKLMEAIPSDVKSLNRKIIPIVQGKEDQKSYMELGIAYQNTGKKAVHNTQLKHVFLDLSNKYLKKVSSKSDHIGKKAALLQLLNMVYKGKSKKAKKKVLKYPNHYFKGDLKELKTFILAYCYKYEGEKAKFEALKNELKNPQYLTELNY